jgi:hypothetical protein
MYQLVVFYLGIFILGVTRGLELSTYSSSLANIGVWLSGSAYCGKDKYKSMVLSGPATGFVYTGTLYDPSTDLQGFVGLQASSKTIWVVFRGSSSILNWLDDFEVKQIKYTSWINCVGCTVHNGFYRAALNLSNKTIGYVQLAQKSHPGYQVVVSGHSLGAAIADLISMELAKEGIVSWVYIYGKPRVGNQAYAKFYSQTISAHYRHTHNKDTVPHVPPIEGFGYYHSCEEIFEDEFGIITLCSKTVCENPKCGDQYTLAQTNTADHSYYLGHHLDCDESTTCAKL